MVESTWTASMVVAANLRRARLMRGWTQGETCERLRPHMEKSWSVAAYSQAERSVDGRRVRRFTADDLVAFAFTFELPIGFFFAAAGPRQATHTESPVFGSTGDSLDGAMRAAVGAAPSVGVFLSDTDLDAAAELVRRSAAGIQEDLEGLADAFSKGADLIRRYGDNR